MDTRTVLDQLGYASSANFLSEGKLAAEWEYAHVYRRAAEACTCRGGRFWGVYCLREADAANAPSTPVVYVADAPTEAAADGIHQSVWNQSVVPFLLVRVDRRVRLYSGFEYGRARKDAPQHGVLEAAIAVDDVLSRISDLHARAIDGGTLWRQRSVEPGKRLDRKLLANLNDLGTRLRKSNLPPEIAHGLIGKFVYLRYLRDRGILSDRRLEDLGVDAHVFGRKARLSSLERLTNRVDEWLNGGVFPIPLTGKDAPTEDQVRLVASVFLGDEAASGQLHLDFQAYDFSYIPIETLSVIYEQFLAAKKKQSAGAYYTPLPVVNFMLAEMNGTRPLTAGMRVLDPSCGSGAFLVQCYRRLVEQRIGETHRGLRATELRDLLVHHIFGVDHDGDACRVTELSLILTMLDYINPPDLVGSRFKLPDLHGTNIFEGDFFDADADWTRAAKNGFDWIVGNPPWVQLDPDDTLPEHHPALAWMAEHSASHPVVRAQVAEAFAWKAADHTTEDGVVGLLLPAMSLVTETAGFRKAFFARNSVRAVANFTNLRRMLFKSRAETAAMAVVYSSRPQSQPGGTLYVYSPLVVNQEVTRPPRPGVRIEPWTITVDRSEIRSIRLEDAGSGGARVWSTAMWGSSRDLRLLANAEKRFLSLEELVKARNLRMSEGLQLRPKGGREPVDAVPEVARKPVLDMSTLKSVGRIHAFPPTSLSRRVPVDRAFVRVGRGLGPVEVCRPPHIIVNASRTFAIYSDQYVVVPPRQVGIAGSRDQEDLLRALALYLSSDFVDYHRFLDSSQAAVRGVSTLASLRRLPTPIASLDGNTLRVWATLHRELVATSERTLSQLIAAQGDDPHGIALMRDMNALVADALQLSEPERWLVHDLVHVRMKLADGQVGPAATQAPSETHLSEYASALRSELDEFVDPALAIAHQVDVVHGQTTAAVNIRLRPRGQVCDPRVLRADQAAAGALEAARDRIERARSQWLYFDRNLVVYDGGATFILKPAQRVWWTRSQALADADELIADALQSQEST